MATLQQLYYKVYMYDSNAGTWKYTYSNSNWETNPNSFFDHELISKKDNQHISKMSIQAPPGTTVYLNNKTILIGRSGLYDFDNADLDITSLIFPRPEIYQRSGVDTDKQTAMRQILDRIKLDLDTAYDGGSDKGYENFANNAEAICLRNSYSGSSGETAMTVTGFIDAARSYLDVLKGKLSVESGDLENVIVNYIVEE